MNTGLITEKINKMLNVFNRNKPREKYRPSWKFKQRKSHLSDYPDYVYASEYYGNFCSLLLENVGYKLQKSDSKEIHDEVTLLRKAHIEMSAIDLQRTKLCIPSEPNRLTGFCSNCMTNYPYDRQAYKQDKKSSSLCQRPECQKGYSVQTTRKHRGVKPTTGEKKRGFCSGENCRGEKRRMLIDGLCSKCIKQS